MTNDIVINNIINDLCQRFNVASSELIPRLQAYGMAMNKFGAIVAGVICAVILIAVIVIVRNDGDYTDLGLNILFTCLAESIPVIVMLYNVYMYIGWKYAPEIKSIEYIMQLFRK